MIPEVLYFVIISVIVLFGVLLFSSDVTSSVEVCRGGFVSTRGNGNRPTCGPGS